MSKEKWGKMTWARVRSRFREKFPTMSKNAVYWRPYDYGEIVVYLGDGKKVVYNDDYGSVRFLKERWLYNEDLKDRLAENWKD